MALLQADKLHPFWGRKYPEYTASYTNEALSVSLMAAHEPKVTSETINRIRELSGSRINTTVDHITLPMLTDLLGAIMHPQQLQLIAVPHLVSGCVTLMASIQPSALEYEYGYVCFCILVISLNACIMKHVGCLDQTIALMNNAAASQRLTTFWGASSCLIYQKSRGKQQIIPSELLDASMLGQLLKLLHRDEKLFFTVLKRTNSLGLSGLMFVLFTHLLRTEDHYRSRDDHFKEVIRPYSRIFWRYFIITPDSEAEEAALFDLHTRVTLYSRLYYDKPVDVEDSINLVQALNDRLNSPRPVSALIVPAMLRFVAPLVVPGCENLIPATIKRCIQILWDFLAVGYDPAYARQSVLNFLLYLRDMLMALKPPQFNDQPWIWEVVDHIINGDVLDLALRVFSTASSSNYDRSDMGGTEGQLFSATIEAYIAISELVPSRELMLRFFYAGCLGAWSKCYFYFRISGTENTFRDTFSTAYSLNWGCGEIVAGVMSILMGSKWDGFAWNALIWYIAA
ncbi:GPI mannosyltransferase 3 [Rhizoctonia solani]|uniref:GPI mannosyltransferase 3 n=1 Tax=Rhizoctonia solani TaxID=456999 RepID=A0A0K6FXP3_9AGAM|nr:GPI mannosyltransferase 3 [Rhizoctonia solani]